MTTCKKEGKNYTRTNFNSFVHVKLNGLKFVLPGNRSVWFSIDKC